MAKPKKGGMVIVIGVGKPKKEKGKGDIKKSAEEKRARARTMSFLQQLKSNPKRLDEVLERRGIERDQFERYMKERVGVDIEQAIEEKENIPQHIDDVAKIIRGNKGQFDEQGNLKPNLLALLERRKINPNVFKRSLEINPFMDFQDRIDVLAEQAFEGRKPQRPPQASIDDIEYDRDEAPPTNDNNDTTEDDHEYPTSRFDAQYPERDSDEEDRLLEFYERLYSHTTDPMQFAINQLRGRQPQSMYDENRMLESVSPTKYKFPGAKAVSQMPSSFEQEHAPPGMRLGSPDEDEDPTVTFDPQSIGVETPKGATANPRVLNDPSKDARQLASTRTLTRDFRMSSDSTNVMDAAWSLLKGNPSMRDAQGKAINHPAAMVYDDISSQINEDVFNPYDRPSATEPIIDDVAAREMEKLRGKTAERGLRYKYGRFERRKEDGPRARHFGVKGRKMPRRSVTNVKIPEEEMLEAKQRDRKSEEKAQKIRQFARERTSQMMNEPDQAAGPNYGMLQSTGTDVKMKEGNIMDQM